ncbi:MAG: SLC13 family permease [Thermomicrobiales bacterium]|nr:SLC13 family permease [Thermomicrobiales bacterium]
MTDQAALILILVVAVIAFAVNRFPVGIVSLGVMISLWATGIISLDDAFGGFGSPTVILIASLFVVAEGLNAAGITTWMGQLITRHAGDSRAGLLTIMMVVVAILTAVITPNGSVAAVYPLVVVLAVRFGYPPSKLLMPTAFAAHAGALLVLTGSPVTLLVADTADHEGLGRLGFFEVSLVGLPLLIGTILVVILAVTVCYPIDNRDRWYGIWQRFPGLCTVTIWPTTSSFDSISMEVLLSSDSLPAISAVMARAIWRLSASRMLITNSVLVPLLQQVIASPCEAITRACCASLSRTGWAIR